MHHILLLLNPCIDSTLFFQKQRIALHSITSIQLFVLRSFFPYFHSIIVNKLHRMHNLRVWHFCLHYAQWFRSGAVAETNADKEQKRERLSERGWFVSYLTLLYEILGRSFAKKFVCDSNGACNFCACWFKIKVKLYALCTKDLPSTHLILIHSRWKVIVAAGVKRWNGNIFCMQPTSLVVRTNLLQRDVLHSTWCNSVFRHARWTDDRIKHTCSLDV